MTKILLALTTLLFTATSLAFWGFNDDEVKPRKRSGNFYVQGAEGFRCQRTPAIYDRITDENFVLQVAEFSPNYEGIPQKIVVANKAGTRIPGEGTVRLQAIHQNQYIYFSDGPGDTRYNLSMLHCLKD